MDSYNVEEIITCGICLETFNGDCRCPRVLTCGHTFCHSCLEKLIDQSPCCPTCKNPFGFEKAALVPINFSLKSLINIKADVISGIISSAKSLDLGEAETSGSDTCAAEPQGTKSKSFLSEGHCEEHGIYVGMRCMDCEVWICGMCVALHHKHCRTLVVEEAYIELKSQLSQKVETEMVKRGETFVALDESLGILDEKRKSLIEEIKEKEQELKDCENRVSELESLKSDERKFSQKLKQLHLLVKSSTIGSKLSKAIKELEKFLGELKNEIPIDLLHLHLPSLPLSKKQLENWCSTGSVYAEEDRFDGTKYGKVAVKDGRILVHNFQSEKPEGRLIPFKELLSKFDTSSLELPNTAFLRLTPTVEEAEDFPIIGRTDVFDILIQTDGTFPRGKNFLLLCSALKGPTYKGKVIKLTVFPNVIPRSTAYQLHPGPAPVGEGIKNNDAQMAIKKGSVYGTFEGNSCFFISLSDCPTETCHAIGSVVSGLEDLIGHEKSLLISDCGLVI